MFSGNGAMCLYIPEGTTREVPYNGSFIKVTNLSDTHELISPWYTIVAGKGSVDGRPVLVAVALKQGEYRRDDYIENLCEPVCDSLRESVENQMRSYLEKQQMGDVGIIVIPELSRI